MKQTRKTITPSAPLQRLYLSSSVDSIGSSRAPLDLITFEQGHERAYNNKNNNLPRNDKKRVTQYFNNSSLNKNDPESSAVHSPTHLRFSPQEFRALQSLYTFFVVLGVWRDYGISANARSCAFLMFYHTAERPRFFIEKSQLRKGVSWSVFNTKKRLSMNSNHVDAIASLRRHIAYKHTGRIGVNASH